MRLVILYFQDVNRPLCGERAYVLNLSQCLVDRGHEVSILSPFGTPSQTRLWSDRLKRTVYSGFILTKISELSRYDVVLFAEPLYPQNVMLLRCLKSLTKAHIVLHVRVPSIANSLYYLPIRGKFPALISGEITRPFAERIASNVALVNPGIDTRKLYPLGIEKKWDLLYVGHLYREKGVLILLQAMKWLKSNGSPLKLKIIHAPSTEAKLYRRYIADNGLDNVDLEAAIITDHLSVYNSARVFVYPGVSYYRVATTPLTVLEASACGLPVVCTSLYRHVRLPNITFTDIEVNSLAGALLQSVSDPSTNHDQTIAIIREKYSLASMGTVAESFFAAVIDGQRAKSTGYRNS